MRITNNLIVRRQLESLQTNARALDKAQHRVTTGLRVSTMSDDPTSGAGIMASASGIEAIEQYRRNVSQAQSRIDAQDQVLQQVTHALTRAKELALGAASDNLGDAAREVVAKELEEIFRHVVALGGNQFGNEYLFGGETAGTQPFAASGGGTTLDFTQDGGVGARQVEIGTNQRFTATHDGQTVFVDTGVLAALRDLTRAAASGTGAAPVRASINAVDAAFDGVQALVGETGARANSLQMTASNLDAFEGSLKALKSDLGDIDFEVAVTELVSKQTAYQAAMLASSKVLGLNLADYLR